MNAIILAAGMGTRIPEISKDGHKALISNQGKPNIENTIAYLLAFGVEKIAVITGHNAHLFDYLNERYEQVTTIYNEQYNTYNNLYSFMQGLDYFDDAFVIDADVILLKNIFQHASDSFYYTIQRPQSSAIEWVPIVEEGRVVKMDESAEVKPSLLGISYWNKEACARIKKAMEALDSSSYTNPKLYWDNIPACLYDELTVRVVEVQREDAIEVDTIEDYQTYMAFQQ